MSGDTNNNDQDRRYALITGASSGIGEEMAIYAAEKGFNVGLTARREDRLNSLATKIRDQYDVEVDVFPMDLSLHDSAQSLITKVSGVNRHIDVLVNNAGMTIPRTFSSTNIEDQTAFLNLTMRTPVVLTHAALKGMTDHGWGRVINISSVMALSSGGKGHTLYPAGKAFLLKFSQSLNAEFKGQNINVSAVLPGVVSTDFQRANGAKEVGSHRFSQTAEQVTRIAWHKNDKGQEIIVPGFSAKIAAVLFNYMPERILRFITRPVAEKYYIEE